MSSADLNKVFGAGLIALLFAVTIGIFINKVWDGGHHGPVERHYAYPVEVAGGAQAATAAAAPEELAPVAALLASADVAAGKKLSSRCAACHSFEKGGATKIGPNLWGVVGGKTAHVDGFSYSSGMAGMAGTWDFETLNAFLANPKGVVPGTKMTFAGITKAQDRAALLAWLNQQSDSPLALPAN
ncbi:MAG: cytochrome c family protein [Alphaproteobacteria bacterium]|nr:cytochrome c family protein [Alphaproteobacteria bacterium]